MISCQPVSAMIPIGQRWPFSTTIPPAQQIAAPIISSGPSGLRAEAEQVRADQERDAEHAQRQGAPAGARSAAP